MATKLLTTCEQVLALKPCSVAMAFNKAPLLMALAPAFIAFMDFIGGSILLDEIELVRVYY